LAKQVSANTLASMAFLNRGDHFEAVSLPAEAQLAPAFALVVADFDGDGAEDVFLSQNFFATEPQTSRCDAGRGLLLIGDAKGALRALSGQVRRVPHRHETTGLLRVVGAGRRSVAAVATRVTALLISFHCSILCYPGI